MMPFKVLTAEMSHETNSYSLQETDEQAFRNRYVLMGPEAIAERGQANTELAGFLDAGNITGDVDIRNGSSLVQVMGRDVSSQRGDVYHFTARHL